MAKKRAKAKAKPGKKREQVKASDVMKMPSEPTVRSIAADITSTLKAKGKLSEELAGVIAEAKKSKGIHPGALKRVERLLTKAKATDRGLMAVATELAHFDYYRDVLGLTKMLDEQGQMFTRPEAGQKSLPKQEPLKFGKGEPAEPTAAGSGTVQ